MVNTRLVIEYLIPGAAYIVDYLLDDSGAIVRWRRPEPQPTPEQIAAAELPSAKALRIESDRLECRRRLTEHYGDALEQGSRIAGDYGEAARVNRSIGVQACIDASNAARDQINAATTVEQVEAVTVAWPVLV